MSNARGVRNRPRIGAHVSTAGGLASCLGRATALGAEAVQIFASNPRQWAAPPLPVAAVCSFGHALGTLELPLFVHSIYLVNLASPDDTLRSQSAAALAHALAFAALAGAAGVVTHVGSHRATGFEAGATRVAATVGRAAEDARRALAREFHTPSLSLPRLLLETSAGGGETLGQSPAELGWLVERLAAVDLAVGVCLDTAHLFAAGYPVHTAPGVEALLQELDTRVGLGRIGLVHLNDSRSVLGSRADRHENIGEGRIGREGLAHWARHPLLRAVPFVLEVPGFKGKGPDRRNLWRARRLGRPAPGSAP